MRANGTYLAEADISHSIYIKEDPSLVSVGHFHEGLELVAVIEGEIEAYLIKQSKKLIPGDIFFANSFECHHYKQLSPEIRCIVIVLSSDYTKIFKSLYHGKSLPTFMTDLENNAEIIEIMRAWLNEKERDYLLDLGYSCQLLSKLVKIYGLQDKKESKDKSVIINLLKFINDHLSEDLSLGKVAKEIGYSKVYCSKTFSEVVGMGFRDYVNFLRIKKVEEQLSLKNITKQTTTEIIYKCGFNSTATFYRAKNSLKKLQSDGSLNK